jgi:hypothetical protein
MSKSKEAETLEKERNTDAYRAGLVHEIFSERNLQDATWGGQEHDENNSRFDWVAIICTHVTRAVKKGKGMEGWRWNPELFRKQMIKVAALAIAAIEWVDAGYAGRDGHGN